MVKYLTRENSSSTKSEVREKKARYHISHEPNIGRTGLYSLCRFSSMQRRGTTPLSGPFSTVDHSSSAPRASSLHDHQSQQHAFRFFFKGDYEVGARKASGRTAEARTPQQPRIKRSNHAWMVPNRAYRGRGKNDMETTAPSEQRSVPCPICGNLQTDMVAP